MFDFDSYRKSKAFALLIDPDKTIIDSAWLSAISKYRPDFILIGGTQNFGYSRLDSTVKTLKGLNNIPLVGFPGDISQIHPQFDALLALSVVQSTDVRFVLNPLFHITPFISANQIAIFYTPYLILGKSGTTAVELFLKDKIAPIETLELLESYLYGLKVMNPSVVYLEAGSGAKKALDVEYLVRTKSILDNVYCIVGGGIRSAEQARMFWASGADCIVVGNWIEDSLQALEELAEMREKVNNPAN